MFETRSLSFAAFCCPALRTIFGIPYRLLPLTNCDSQENPKQFKAHKMERYVLVYTCTISPHHWSEHPTSKCECIIAANKLDLVTYFRTTATTKNNQQQQRQKKKNAPEHKWYSFVSLYLVGLEFCVLWPNSNGTIEMYNSIYDTTQTFQNGMGKKCSVVSTVVQRNRRERNKQKTNRKKEKNKWKKE